MSSRKIKLGEKEVDKKKFYFSILMMVEKICNLLRMIKKFMKCITKYGK